VGAALRPDLQTLDDWPNRDLLDLAAKYVTGAHNLSDLRAEVSQVRSSSGDAPPYQMPDSDTCKVPERRYTQRMKETARTSEAGCRQECKSTPGCHCIEYYPDARGCVLVAKGTRRIGVPWLWWDKPDVTRLDQCGETGDVC